MVKSYLNNYGTIQNITGVLRRKYHQYINKYRYNKHWYTMSKNVNKNLNNSKLNSNKIWNNTSNVYSIKLTIIKVNYVITNKQRCKQ